MVMRDANQAKKMETCFVRVRRVRKWGDLRFGMQQVY
jgi:hypothetical protein